MPLFQAPESSRGERAFFSVNPLITPGSLADVRALLESKTQADLKIRQSGRPPKKDVASTAARAAHGS